MDFTLTPAQEGLRRRAAAFVDDVCIPLEQKAELRGLDADDKRRVLEASFAAGMVGAGHRKEHGGAELSMVEQVIVHEELGRNTNAVWWCDATAATTCSALGTPEQIERYLKPSLRGERADAYAVTERERGLRRERHRRHRRAHRRRLPDPGREVVRDLGRRGRLLHRHGQRRRRRRPPADAVPGRPRAWTASTFVDDPPFTHNYPHGHPTIRFDVRGAGGRGAGRARR